MFENKNTRTELGTLGEFGLIDMISKSVEIQNPESILGIGDDAAVIEKRKNWFTKWLQQHPQPAPDEILHFHQFTGDGDSHNDLRMNRNGQMLTVSVTLMAVAEEAIHMQYLDLKNNRTFAKKMVLEKS